MSHSSPPVCGISVTQPDLTETCSDGEAKIRGTGRWDLGHRPQGRGGQHWAAADTVARPGPITDALCLPVPWFPHLCNEGSDRTHTRGTLEQS